MDFPSLPCLTLKACAPDALYSGMPEVTRVACNSYQLSAQGGAQSLNVGTTWVAGVIWGSPIGSANNSAATQMEFSINPPGNGNNDTYDISLVVR